MKLAISILCPRVSFVSFMTLMLACSGCVYFTGHPANDPVAYLSPEGGKYIYEITLHSRSYPALDVHDGLKPIFVRETNYIDLNSLSGTVEARDLALVSSAYGGAQQDISGMKAAGKTDEEIATWLIQRPQFPFIKSKNLERATGRVVFLDATHVSVELQTPYYHDKDRTTTIEPYPMNGTYTLKPDPTPPSPFHYHEIVNYFDNSSRAQPQPTPPANKPTAANAISSPDQLPVPDTIRATPKSRADLEKLPHYGNPAPGSSKIYVTGSALKDSVKRPGVYFLTGPVTVRLAIAASGGLSDFVSPFYCFVFRMQNNQEHILGPWCSWATFNDFALQEGDILYLSYEIY